MELGIGTPRAGRQRLPWRRSPSVPASTQHPPQLPPTCSCLPEHSTKNTGSQLRAEPRLLSPMAGEVGCSGNPLGPAAIIKLGSPFVCPQNRTSTGSLWWGGQAEPLRAEVNDSKFIAAFRLVLPHCPSRRLLFGRVWPGVRWNNDDVTPETCMGINMRASPTPNLLICTSGSPTHGKGKPLVPNKNIHLCG